MISILKIPKTLLTAAMLTVWCTYVFQIGRSVWLNALDITDQYME